MRKVIFEIAVSLDGYIEGPNGELDWLVFDEEAPCEKEYINGFDTVFYGRVAYEKFGIAPGEDERDCILNNMRKYVFSRTKKHVAGNAMVIDSDRLLTEVRRIRDESGKNIWFCGGRDILNTFIDLDLIDEYILAIQPVMLGSGKPLFKNFSRRVKLRLLRTYTLKSGTVALHYVPVNRIEN